MNQGSNNMNNLNPNGMMNQPSVPNNSNMNYSNGVNPQPTPYPNVVAPQPVQYPNPVTQQPSMTPVTGSTPNGNPPKKKNMAVFIGIGIAVVVVIVAAIFLLSSNHKKGDSKTDKENASGSTQTEDGHLNNSKSTDDIGFIVTLSSNSTAPNFFVGMHEEGIAKPIAYTKKSYINGLANDVMYLESFGKSSTSTHFSINDRSWRFSIEPVSYSENNGKVTFTYYESLYNEGNYYVVQDSANRYLIYYLSDKPKENESTYALGIYQFSSLEEAKAAITEYNDTLYICSYTDEETIAKCQHQNYHLINDITMDYLRENDLYVKSYDRVTLDSTLGIRVLVDDYIFQVSIEPGENSYLDSYKKFQVNGKDYYINDGNIYYNSNGNQICIYVYKKFQIDLPDDEVLSVFQKEFSKE